MLAQIPQECSLYNKAQTTLLSAYRKQINHNSATLLNQAQATWAANPTSEMPPILLPLYQKLIQAQLVTHKQKL